MVYFRCDEGTTPITKNRGHIIFTAKGMTPIEKNIIVVDEFGNEYEATYPKRAKGLVKCGRARFIDENKICMLCPPKNETEDSNMSENKKVDVNVEAEAEINAVTEVKPEKLTANYCLEQIEKIQAQTDYLNNAVAELGKITAAGPGDVAGQEKGRALGEIVKSREATNQRLIAFYEKMYDDLTSKNISLKELALRGLAGASDDEGKIAAFSDALDTISHIG